jgi:hypothetical protein
MTNALRRIQSLARLLDQIELRVLLDLTARAETPLFGSPCLVACSLGQISETSGLRERHVGRGLRSLEALGLIQTLKGTNTVPSCYHLLCLEGHHPPRVRRTPSRDGSAAAQDGGQSENGGAA